MALSSRDISSLKLQKILSVVTAPLIHPVLVLISRLRFGYRFQNLPELRERIWRELDRHPGPVIWAPNHLTLIDSFLIFYAVFPWYRTLKPGNIPWSTPEFRNYYQLGGSWKGRWIRAALYLCRSIPFLREGEDDAAVLWRENVFEKCAWILKNNGAVFVYPEAGRSRKGWLEPHHPKDFLGKLAGAVPRTRFLCLYLRADHQLYATVYPANGENFRGYAEIVPPHEPGCEPRKIAQDLFNVLARLQENWFKESGLAKNCSGNDVVDLKSPLSRAPFFNGEGRAEPDHEWLERHLTAKELQSLPKDAGQAYPMAWKYIAAKEAAYKALSQGGIHTPVRGYRMMEADLFRRRVIHQPTGTLVDIAFTHEDQDKIHCIAVLRGGYIGDDAAPGDVIWGVSEIPAGAQAGDFAREEALKLISGSSEDIPSTACLAFGDENGIPQVLLRGRKQDWGVSLSHSGRYAAYSFMAT